jgi:hypothetical protein
MNGKDMGRSSHATISDNISVFVRRGLRTTTKTVRIIRVPVQVRIQYRRIQIRVIPFQLSSPEIHIRQRPA